MRKITKKQLIEWILKELDKKVDEGKVLKWWRNDEEYYNEIEILERYEKVWDFQKWQQRIKIVLNNTKISRKDSVEKVIEKLRKAKDLTIEFCLRVKLKEFENDWFIGELFGKYFYVVDGMYKNRRFDKHEWVLVIEKGKLFAKIFEINENEFKSLYVVEKL